MRLTAERSAAYNGDLGPSSFCLNMHGGTDLVAKILERIIEALEADSPDGDVLRHGHARRLFTPAQAQAIRAKFWRCAHPYGCDRTYPFLQSDHMTEHTRAAAPTPGSGPPERG